MMDSRIPSIKHDEDQESVDPSEIHVSSPSLFSVQYRNSPRFCNKHHTRVSIAGFITPESERFGNPRPLTSTHNLEAVPS